jgi:hypothetical protein
MGFLEKSLQVAANQMMQDIGRIDELHIDSKGRTASAVVMLEGEPEPLHITVGRYEVVKSDDGKTFMHLHQVTFSKEWLSRLAEKLESQMNFEIPRAAASLLRLAGIA